MASTTLTSQRESVPRLASFSREFRAIRIGSIEISTRSRAQESLLRVTSVSLDAHGHLTWAEIVWDSARSGVIVRDLCDMSVGLLCRKVRHWHTFGQWVDRHVIEECSRNRERVAREHRELLDRLRLDTPSDRPENN